MNHVPDMPREEYQGVEETRLCFKCQKERDVDDLDHDGICLTCAEPNKTNVGDSLMKTPATENVGSTPTPPTFHPCPTCGQQTEGARGRVTGCVYPICNACMKKEEDGVDAAIQAVCFLVRQVAPHFAGNVKTPLPGDSFSQWLKANNDSLPEPQSFTQWLDQTGDSINENTTTKHTRTHN